MDIARNFTVYESRRSRHQFAHRKSHTNYFEIEGETL